MRVGFKIWPYLTAERHSAERYQTADPRHTADVETQLEVLFKNPAAKFALPAGGASGAGVWALTVQLSEVRTPSNAAAAQSSDAAPAARCSATR